ncbi:MAG: PAS domain-containing protein, partial [Oscillospiraceae bacterium]
IDTINDSIYACDKSTYELIYANDNLCKIMGVTREQYKNKKCYEVLMHKTSPCEFCSMSKMSENHVYTRLFKMPDTSTIFLMRGKTINRGGTMIHLEVAVDISEVENMNLYWEEALDHEKK